MRIPCHHELHRGVRQVVGRRCRRYLMTDRRASTLQLQHTIKMGMLHRQGRRRVLCRLNKSTIRTEDLQAHHCCQSLSRRSSSNTSKVARIMTEALFRLYLRFMATASYRSRDMRSLLPNNGSLIPINRNNRILKV